MEQEGEQRTFVGYHGTSILSVPSLLRGVAPPIAGNFGLRRQLGIGFYVTADFPAAVEFAEAALDAIGGYPAVVEVFVVGFERMRGQEVPEELWWHLLDDSPYITEFDYLTAATYGYPAIRQLKFNPRAYGALKLELPQ